VQIQPRFPEQDVRKSQLVESYYEAAAVCRRGHVKTERLKPSDYHADDEKCTKCGATVLVGCANCGLRIRGAYFADLADYALPSFCDGCGVAHPWATREQRIYELENILDEEDIDEANRVFIHDRLRELREAEDLDVKREQQLWAQIKDRSGRFLNSPSVQSIIGTVVAAGIRQQLNF
jgi:hypothetical protein